MGEGAGRVCGPDEDTEGRWRRQKWRLWGGGRPCVEGKASGVFVGSCAWLPLEGVTVCVCDFLPGMRG